MGAVDSSSTRWNPSDIYFLVGSLDKSMQNEKELIHLLAHLLIPDWKFVNPDDIPSWP